MTDDPALEDLRQRHGPRYRWWLLLAVMSGSMAAIMSSTIMNVAIPDLSRHFTLGQEQAQWVTSSFMLAMILSMLATPWLLARFGYRNTYMGSMSALILGGIGGGLSHDFNLVLAARVVEGLAAGVVQPIPAIIIMLVFEPGQQGRANGMFGMGVVLAPAIGPSIGGVLVDAFGWRSIFFLVVPLCLAAMALVLRFVPAHRSADLLAAEPGAPEPGRRRRWGLALFDSPVFTMASLVAFIYGAALFGSTYLIPVYMLMGLNLSASTVGLIFLPAGLVLAITIAGAGRLADRYPMRPLVMSGLGLLAASFALMAATSAVSALWLLALVAIIGRVGLGLILPSLSLGALRALPSAQLAQGASAMSLIRMLGGAIGVSLCAVVLEWRVAARGGALAQSTISVAEQAAREAAFAETFLFLAALCLLAQCAAWRLRGGGA
jgi:MFS family permease